ncbi:MAG TPA: class I SAM-dependent methyltransferase [Anaerolineales bacterium]|nr:class I SAM-dependent methyltransferase [Anaerolineales bacterium]
MSQVRRSKNTTQRAYDRMSHVYDWLAGSSETRLILQGIELLAVNSGESILEIGCGTGRALVEFCSRSASQAQVFGLDLSRGMLRVAGSRVMKGNLGENIHLLEGNGRSLPIGRGRFSAIFISFTLELFDTPEIRQVLAECH